MTMETLVAFGAAVIFLVLLPSPLTALIARFSLQKGRTTACATLPGLALGMAAAMTIVALPLTAITLVTPALIGALSWLGVAYLMLYVLWSFQDPAIRGAVADNDNLPEQSMLGIFVHFVTVALRTPRYFLLMAAILVQFIPEAVAQPRMVLDMPAVFFFAVLFGAAVHAVFPQWPQKRQRRKTLMTPASRKLGTRFIARRAVTAGYRRIAA